MASKRTGIPSPAYPKPQINDRFYESLAITANSTKRNLLLSHVIPPRSGYSWEVPAGSIFRLSTPEGAQVGDLNIWNLHNPRERFWASRTRQLQASHVTVGDQLWSSLPYLRPMCTIIADSLQNYGVDEFGGRCHDLLGTRCDPYVNSVLTGDSFDFHCHSNLTRAILPRGLTEYDVHDVLNVFQVTGLNKEGRYFMETSPAVTGSYLEFFAEIDLLCALSTCPGGDLSSWSWAEGSNDSGSMENTCRPIEVEVWKIDCSLLEDWKSPVVAPYRDIHGLKLPEQST